MASWRNERGFDPDHVRRGFPPRGDRAARRAGSSACVGRRGKVAPGRIGTSLEFATGLAWEPNLYLYMGLERREVAVVGLAPGSRFDFSLRSAVVTQALPWLGRRPSIREQFASGSAWPASSPRVRSPA